MSDSLNNEAVPAIFVPMDGLAGDVRVVKADVARRNEQISTLEQEFIAITERHQREEKKINASGFDTQNRLEDQILSLMNEVKKMKQDRECAIHIAGDKYRHMLESVQERLSVLRTKNSHDLWRIAPIRKVPVEMLSNIFCIFVDLGGSPLILIKVSKGWQQQALALPQLWNRTIFMSNPPRPEKRWQMGTINGVQLYSHGKRVVCHNIVGFRVLINLAGALTLHVELVSRTPHNGTHEFLLFLFKPSISSRIVSLRIDDGNFRTPRDLAVGPLHRLQQVILKASGATLNQVLFDSMARSRTSPRSMQLKTFAKLPVNRGFWQDLRLLDLGGGTTPDHLNLVIGFMSSLENLWGGPKDWPDEYTPQVRLPYLILLEVTCDPQYLLRLDCPKLNLRGLYGEIGVQRLPTCTRYTFIPGMFAFDPAEVDPDDIAAFVYESDNGDVTVTWNHPGAVPRVIRHVA
jgi:hypothetical protein